MSIGRYIDKLDRDVSTLLSRVCRQECFVVALDYLRNQRASVRGDAAKSNAVDHKALTLFDTMRETHLREIRALRSFSGVVNVAYLESLANEFGTPDVVVEPSPFVPGRRYSFSALNELDSHSFPSTRVVSAFVASGVLDKTWKGVTGESAEKVRLLLLGREYFSVIANYFTGRVKTTNYNVRKKFPAPLVNVGGETRGSALWVAEGSLHENVAALLDTVWKAKRIGEIRSGFFQEDHFSADSPFFSSRYRMAKVGIRLGFFDSSVVGAFEEEFSVAMNGSSELSRLYRSLCNASGIRLGYVCQTMRKLSSASAARRKPVCNLLDALHKCS